MRGCHLYIAGHQFQCGYGACDLTFPLRTMSLLNEAYRLRYTGESAGAAKKRKALAHLDETVGTEAVVPLTTKLLTIILTACK